MLVVEGFQKFAGIPFGISRIFESLMPQEISAIRRKNRSIQVRYGLLKPANNLPSRSHNFAVPSPEAVPSSETDN